MEGSWFFRHIKYLESRAADQKPKPKKPDWRQPTDQEASSMAEAGLDPIVWRLSMHSHLPFKSILDVLKTPINVLFQSEIMADMFDRIERRQKIEDSINAAFRAAASRGSRRR